MTGGHPERQTSVMGWDGQREDLPSDRQGLDEVSAEAAAVLAVG